MWKRDETVRAESPVLSADLVKAGTRVSASVASSGDVSSSSHRQDIVNIGKSVIIKGELSGSEDLIIEGKVNGQIELPDHLLTIGPNGKIKATIHAKSVAVMGHVIGNISASDKINIRENGRVEGDINAPIVAIAEGAQFRGSIDMGRQAVARESQPGSVTSAKVKSKPKSNPDMGRAAKPAAAPAPAARAAY